MTDANIEYRRRYDQFLQTIAAKLEAEVRSHLVGVKNIDRVSARAKAPDRFAEKAARSEAGKTKYTRPLTEIQDQLGVRIIVFYRDDVEPVIKELIRYYRPIE